jgi:hypothetical protein
VCAVQPYAHLSRPSHLLFIPPRALREKSFLTCGNTIHYRACYTAPCDGTTCKPHDRFCPKTDCNHCSARLLLLLLLLLLLSTIAGPAGPAGPQGLPGIQGNDGKHLDTDTQWHQSTCAAISMTIFPGSLFFCMRGLVVYAYLISPHEGLAHKCIGAPSSAFQPQLWLAFSCFF